MVGWTGAGAGEVDRRLAPFPVDGDLGPDDGALVGLDRELGIVERLDDPADAFGGVVLDVAHIGAHDVEPEMVDHLRQLLHALLVGGDLRLEVGDVLRRVAARDSDGR